jgi:hypothetical protein
MRRRAGNQPGRGRVRPGARRGGASRAGRATARGGNQIWLRKAGWTANRPDRDEYRGPDYGRGEYRGRDHRREGFGAATGVKAVERLGDNGGHG